MVSFESLNLWQALGVMAVAFVILAKCADWLVDGAIDIARQLSVPPILIGIVIVSIGTTAPELAVSLMAALGGNAELALANAVGSVIYDDGLALPLVAFFAPAVVVIDKGVLRSTAIFLIAVDLIAYAMCFDGTLHRPEGAVLVLGFCGYLPIQTAAPACSHERREEGGRRRGCAPLESHWASFRGRVGRSAPE